MKAQTRTVTASELGGIFTAPNGFSWNDFGAYVGISSTASASSLAPDAIKAGFTRLHVFGQTDFTGFPYSQLRSYEASEVAAGRPPIFITATYQGKKRPVIWGWSLNLDSNNSPTTPPDTWRYAVNLGDYRFIQFWIDQYMRPMMKQKYNGVQNLWWSLDECAFNYGVYGVLDDSNHFVSGVTWDAPFPQDDDAYLNSVMTAFYYIKMLAPEINVMPNYGSMRNPGRFSEVFSDIPGISLENMYDGQNPSGYLRNARMSDFDNVSWFGAQGRVGILRSEIPQGDPVAMRTALVIYELVKGPNFFFAPAIDGSGSSMPTSAYIDAKNKLGQPTATFQSTLEPGMWGGYRLFSRTFSGGIVYLNWTGTTKTVVLPSDRPYYDPNGSRVTQISIPDGTGTYVTN
jgi:hypothetical protein